MNSRQTTVKYRFIVWFGFYSLAVSAVVFLYYRGYFPIVGIFNCCHRFIRFYQYIFYEFLMPIVHFIAMCVLFADRIICGLCTWINKHVKYDSVMFIFQSYYLLVMGIHFVEYWWDNKTISSLWKGRMNVNCSIWSKRQACEWVRVTFLVD